MDDQSTSQNIMSDQSVGQPTPPSSVTPDPVVAPVTAPTSVAPDPVVDPSPTPEPTTEPSPPAADSDVVPPSPVSESEPDPEAVPAVTPDPMQTPPISPVPEVSTPEVQEPEIAVPSQTPSPEPVDTPPVADKVDDLPAGESMVVPDPSSSTVQPAVEGNQTVDDSGKGAGKYKVTVEASKCIGAASCVAVAPKAFKLNEQQIAEVVSTISEETDENLLLAAQSCPTLAIQIMDTETNQVVWPK